MNDAANDLTSLIGEADRLWDAAWTARRDDRHELPVGRAQGASRGGNSGRRSI
jgi:hypothetical protein